MYSEVVEMNQIKFTVLGAPVAQPRTKAQGFIKNGRVLAHVYEPGRKDSPARQWKSDIKTAALPFINGSALWQGAVSLHVKLFFPRPGTLCRKKDPEGAVPMSKGKDWDNCGKAVSDALNGVVYVDDRQICSAFVEKYYHEKTGRPRAEIELRELEV
jgi:Holliday junction resolvase RusA-like endonuclease